MSEGRTRVEFRVIAFIGFVTVAIVGLIGILMIVHFRPDASATVINAVITLLGLVSGFAVVAFGLARVEKRVDEVHKQTNGTLSMKDAKIELQAERIKELEGKLND